jgi:Zn-dependent protease
LLRGRSFPEDIPQITAILIVILLALTVHEISHGLAAYALGDPTAKREGRFSFNPIKHLDPIGFLMILFVGFGWAKPVMVNPYNLKNTKVDMALIAAAGPVSNFLMALITAFIYVALFLHFDLPSIIYFGLMIFCQINIVLGVFNLIPFPPLDGSKIVAGALPEKIYDRLPNTGRYGMFVFFILAMTGMLGEIISPAVTWLLSVVFNLAFFVLS